MDNYTDMAARTVTAQARIRAKEMEFLAHGQNLVRISHHLPTCPLCAPWNGVIVSLAEPTEEYPHTLDEARAAGLLHPACIHSISLMAPGFSEPGPSEPDYSDEAKRRNEEARAEARRTPEVAKRLDPRLKLLTASNVTGIIEKLTGYSLKPDHKDGGNKAIVFESALGYNLGNAKELQSAILSGLANADKYYKEKNAYGDKFNVIMTIKGPNGQQARVVTGWILEGDSTKPRMTTAYVEKGKKRGKRNEGK
jgi:hypothetical protein